MCFDFVRMVFSEVVVRYVSVRSFSAMVMAVILCMVVGMAGCAATTSGSSSGSEETQQVSRSLPAPSPASGERGALGIDANVDETTIDLYLGLPNVVYRDVRMLDDDANWEAIGGDSMLSGYVDGFEVVPYPYLAPLGTLPEAVGTGYTGPTLFVEDGNGGYKPAYNESLDILEDLFPPDKDIVLMCGGGGYAGNTKNLLVSLGWDANHIWNAGGWWYYQGSHGIKVSRDNGHGQTTWDFHKVPTHVIDFDALHSYGSEGETAHDAVAELADGLPRLSSQAELNERLSSVQQGVAYVYLPGCTSCAKFAPVAAELAGTGLPTWAISYNDLSDMSLRRAVGHAPGVLAFRDGKLVSSLSADRDEDIPAYHSLEGLTSWLSGHLDVPVSQGTATADVECGEGCEP